MQITIIGTGYVGLTSGVCFALLGHQVTCVDTDESKIEGLRSGKIPIYEPGLDELLAESRPNLRFTTRAEEAIPSAEVVFLAVGTPPLPNGSPNLSYVRSAAQAVGAHLEREYAVVVNKSTVPIGSGNWVGAIVRESFISRKGRKPDGCFAVASNPEFLREGTAIHDTLYPDRVVIGSDDSRALEMLYTLYRPVLEQTFAAPAFLPRPEGLAAVPLIATDLASAELIKYAANAFLALKISYINEIAQLAEKVGAEVSQVAKGIGLDSRIGTRFLQAGVGWGGSCFGKDTSALISTAQEYNLTMPIVSAAREVNYRQRERVVEKLQAELKILKGRAIGLLGVAFKPNTDDLREAPALEIARKLIDRGATVRAHDPVALERARREHASLEIGWCETAEQLAQDADALVLVTEWPEYRELDWELLASRMKSPLVLDGRLFLDRARLSKSGLRCVGVFG
jgi:UDPglucose 6-dehydrogenase